MLLIISRTKNVSNVEALDYMKKGNLTSGTTVYIYRRQRKSFLWEITANIEGDKGKQ